MAIKIETTKFVAAHGKSPKGLGTWQFALEASHGIEGVKFAAPSNCTFPEACALARKAVRRYGFQDAVLQVLP